jgi:RND family efflux transporter MFP subunit
MKMAAKNPVQTNRRSKQKEEKEMINMPIKTVVPAAVAALLIAGSGCKKDQEAPTMPAPAVEVAHPTQKDVTVYLKYPGQVRAKEIIEIQARVRGYLESVDFTDGAMVKKGQKLFTIEKTVYEANVAKAEANVAKAEAQVKVTKTSLERMRNAYKTKAVSEIDVLVAEGNYEGAVANLMAAKAQLESARQDLSYTTVTAPVTGRISRHLVSVGNLVGATGPTKLAELVTIDPIQAYFNVDERTSLQFVREAGGVRGVVKQGSYSVKLELADGKSYEADGDVDYVGNIIDRETGTISVRALFPNKDGILISGMFSKILVPRKYEQAILVPAAIIQRDMVGTFVYVVNGESKVESRYVELGPLHKKDQIITKGLKKDDNVIVKGMIKVRPGMKVSIDNATKEKQDSPEKTAPEPTKTKTEK